MRLRFRFLMVVLAASLAACSSSPTTTSSSGTSASSPDASAAPSGDAIKIGVDLPVSGADASIGIPTQNGAVLAIEQANAKGFAGGKFKLAAVLLDDAVQGKHDPAAGAQNVKTFIADSSVLAMVGPFNSNVAKSEIPLTNDAGLTQISPSNTSDALTVGDAAKALRTSHPDTIAYFRVCTNDTNQGGALAQFAKKLHYAKAFIIDDNETYGKGLADSFEAHFTKAGGTALGHEHITANQQDFKALLTKIKSAGPDMVFFGGTTSTGGGLIRRQMGDVGMAKVGYMGGDGISDPEFISTAGSMADGAYFSVAAPDATKLFTAKSFVSAYKARFKSNVGGYSASAYAATNVIIAAIAKAIEADGGKVPTRAEVLANVAATKDFSSPIGHIGFDANGDILSPALTLQKVDDGKVVTVDVITVKS
jgi:branched-chain amino acid transport system substrate-binding protein